MASHEPVVEKNNNAKKKNKGGSTASCQVAVTGGSVPGKAITTDSAGIDRHRYHVRKNVLKGIFFPQYAHKDCCAEGHHEQHLEALKKGDTKTAAALQEGKGCREKVVDFIHTKTMQCALLLLLVLDVFIVIAEIILLSHKTCQVEVHHSHGCTEHNMTVTDGVITLDHGCGLEVFLELPHNLHTAEEVLGWTSFAILVIFALELITLFSCLCHKFFTAMYLLDVVVIFGSLIMFFTVNDDDKAASSLVIFVRVWRFARILHGFGLTVHDYDKENMGGSGSDDDDEEGEMKKTEVEPTK